MINTTTSSCSSQVYSKPIMIDSCFTISTASSAAHHYCSITIDYQGSFNHRLPGSLNEPPSINPEHFSISSLYCQTTSSALSSLITSNGHLNHLKQHISPANSIILLSLPRIYTAVPPSINASSTSPLPSVTAAQLHFSLYHHYQFNPSIKLEQSS